MSSPKHGSSSGLSEEVREFSIIWAVGSILGVTRAVDMKFTKKFGQPRMKVAVLNPELIPDLVDVVNGEEPQPIDMDAPFDDDNGGAKGNGDEDPMDDGGKDGKQVDSAPKQPPPLPETGSLPSAK